MIRKKNLLSVVEENKDDFAIDIVSREQECVIQFATEIQLRPGKDCTPVPGDAEQQLLYVLSGRGLMEAGDESVTIEQGDRVTVPSAEPFRILNIGDTDLHLFHLGLERSK